MKASLQDRLIKLSAPLTESSELDPIRELILNCVNANPAKPVKLDFSDVPKANSVGLLKWVRVLSELAPKQVRLIYVDSPSWMVEQFGMIDEFFTGEVTISSFFARFYCPSKDIIVMRKLVLGSDVPLLHDYEAFDIALSGDDQSLEPDFEIPVFFSFLAKHYDKFKRLSDLS
jgi:hypothetical protein